MRANELIQSEDVDTDELRKYIVFKDELNPKFWQEDHQMVTPVRLKLLKAAIEFYNFLELSDLQVEDIIVCGSNASFNYTDLSDLDVHLIVDYTKGPCPNLIENFFTTKKTLWNSLHNISILGQDVEMYVQDTKGHLETNGVYSLLKNKWLVEPKAQKPSWDDVAVVAKTNALADEIDSLVNGEPEMSQIDELLAKIKTMRRAGLAAGGEFSTENLAFKSLRNLGYMARLFQKRNDLQDGGLSIR
jgi:tellurite resistance-related uncharacterized protein